MKKTKVVKEPKVQFKLKPFHEILYDPLDEVPKAEVIRKRT
jgi:hypothetical protein